MELIGARYVLPISSPPILDGAIAFEGADILAIGTQKELCAQYPDAPFRRFDQHALMPGLVNAYCSLDMSLFDAEEIPSRFIEWQAITIAFRRSQSAVKRRSAILEGLQRALSWGVTTLADTSHYSGILETVKDTGLRLMISPEITGTPQKNYKLLFSDIFNTVDEINDRCFDRIRVGLSPYTPYALSRNLLKIIATQAREGGIPVSIQAASSFCEMEFFFESKGDIANIFFPKIGWTEDLPLAQRKTPIQFLESIRFLDCHPAIIGCIHVSETDIGAIKKSKSKVIHIPIVSRHFDLGLTPVKKLRNAGISVALGTGAFGAVTKQSLWDTLRAALKLHGDIAGEALTAEELLRMSTLEGAQALNWSDEIGSLEAGKRADFIVIELSSTQPLEHVPLTLIHETTPNRITKVYVNGDNLK